MSEQETIGIAILRTRDGVEVPGEVLVVTYGGLQMLRVDMPRKDRIVTVLFPVASVIGVCLTSEEEMREQADQYWGCKDAPDLVERFGYSLSDEPNDPEFNPDEVPF